MQPLDNGNNSHKTENVEARPIAENEPIAGTRQQHIFKSILKSRLHEPGSESFNRPNTNISWQDFHGQELTMVHEFVPRYEHVTLGWQSFSWQTCAGKFIICCRCDSTRLNFLIRLVPLPHFYLSCCLSSESADSEVEDDPGAGKPCCTIS